MIKFINRITGTVMWVSEDRAEEYKSAGHKPAAIPPAAKPAVKQVVKSASKKTKK